MENNLEGLQKIRTGTIGDRDVSHKALGSTTVSYVSEGNEKSVWKRHICATAFIASLTQRARYGISLNAHQWMSGVKTGYINTYYSVMKSYPLQHGPLKNIMLS